MLKSLKLCHIGLPISSLSVPQLRQLIGIKSNESGNPPPRCAGDYYENLCGRFGTFGRLVTGPSLNHDSSYANYTGTVTPRRDCGPASPTQLPKVALRLNTAGAPAERLPDRMLCGVVARELRCDAATGDSGICSVEVSGSPPLQPSEYGCLWGYAGKAGNGSGRRAACRNSSCMTATCYRTQRSGTNTAMLSTCMAACATWNGRRMPCPMHSSANVKTSLNVTRRGSEAGNFGGKSRDRDRDREGMREGSGGMGRDAARESWRANDA